MERHDRQMTPAHGASDEESRDMEPCLIGGTRMKEKDPTTLKAFFSIVLLLFLRCNPCFSFAYKRGSMAPHERGGLNTRARHKHTAERQASSQHLFTPFTRELGSVPLLPICNPYCKLSVLVTRAAAMN